MKKPNGLRFFYFELFLALLLFVYHFMFNLSIQKLLLKDILEKLNFHFFKNTW